MLQSAFLTDTGMEVMNFNIWLYGSKASVQMIKHREFISFSLAWAPWKGRQ